MSEVPKWLSMDIDEARERVLNPRNRETVMRVLAALDQWRTMSVQQLEALTDISGFAKGDVSLLSAMWNAGLLEICVLGAAFRKGPRDRDGILLRPTKKTVMHTEFAETLSYAEWVSMTAGLDLDADRQYARHNILAAEFALRISEFGNVGMVLGEKLSSMAMLAYSGVGADVPSSGAAGSSDLTLIRPDGLRIAVEVTATVSGGWFYDKVEKLVRTLHRRPLAETGLCVLFVVAPRRDETEAHPRQVMKKVKRDVQKAVQAYPGHALDPTAARVGVVSWTDLFPAEGEAAPDFGMLPVERPVGAGYIGNADDESVWVRSHFLNPQSVPFSPHDTRKMTAVFGNGAGLRGVPHVFRRKPSWKLMSDLVSKRAGLLHLVGGGRQRGGVKAPGIPERMLF